LHTSGGSRWCAVQCGVALDPLNTAVRLERSQLIGEVIFLFLCLDAVTDDRFVVTHLRCIGATGPQVLPTKYHRLPLQVGGT